LLDLASRQARYYTANNSYTTSMAALGYASDAPNPVPTAASPTFLVSVASVTAATANAPAFFALQAVPQGGQAQDSCGTFGYTDLGSKTVSGGTVADCWGQ
jgi:type IV pilus assembly protein PilE